MKTHRFLLTVLLLFGVVLLEAAPAKKKAIRPPTQAEKELRQQQNELKRVRNKIKKERIEVEKKKAQERGVSGQIADLEKGVRRQSALVEQLGNTQKALQQAMIENSHRIDSLDGSIETRRLAVAKRVKELYMKGKPRSAELFVRAAQRGVSPASLYMWNEVLESDRRLVNDLRNVLEQQQLERGQLAVRQEQNSVLYKEQIAERKNLEKQRSQKEAVLAQLKNDRVKQEQLVKEHEASQAALLAVIKKLEEARRKAEAARLKAEKEKRVAVTKKSTPSTAVPKFARCWPLAGEVVAPFGLVRHQGMGTITRNLGIEIAGKEGRAVRAVAAGSVAYVGPIQGQGLSLILIHGNEGYYSVYAHLDQVKVKNGQHVGSCQELAKVVDVGSRYGVTLFFQLKQGLESLDPMIWLKGARKVAG